MSNLAKSIYRLCRENVRISPDLWIRSIVAFHLPWSLYLSKKLHHVNTRSYPCSCADRDFVRPALFVGAGQCHASCRHEAAYRDDAGGWLGLGKCWLPSRSSDKGGCHAKHRQPGPGRIGIGPALRVPGVFSVTIVANQRTATHSRQWPQHRP